MLFRQHQQAKQWHDYGPTLAAEELAAEHGLRIGKETLRKWLTEAGLWQVRRARVERVHTWRARRARWGELLQWDTSEHDWLEGRSRESLYLIAMIDDASSRVLARFVRHDSTEENLRLLSESTWNSMGVRWRSIPTRRVCFRPRPKRRIIAMLPWRSPRRSGGRWVN